MPWFRKEARLLGVGLGVILAVGVLSGCAPQPDSSQVSSLATPTPISGLAEDNSPNVDLTEKCLGIYGDELRQVAVSRLISPEEHCFERIDAVEGMHFKEMRQVVDSVYFDSELAKEVFSKSLNAFEQLITDLNAVGKIELYEDSSGIDLLTNKVEFVPDSDGGAKIRILVPKFENTEDGKMSKAIALGQRWEAMYLAAQDLLNAMDENSVKLNLSLLEIQYFSDYFIGAANNIDGFYNPKGLSIEKRLLGVDYSDAVYQVLHGMGIDGRSKLYEVIRLPYLWNRYGYLRRINAGQSLSQDEKTEIFQIEQAWLKAYAEFTDKEKKALELIKAKNLVEDGFFPETPAVNPLSP